MFFASDLCGVLGFQDPLGAREGVGHDEAPEEISFPRTRTSTTEV